MRYAVRVRLVDGNGNQVAESNWSLATAGGTAVPTLVSDASRTVRAGSGGTVAVCYNLLSVIHNGVTYLEKRRGQTTVQARSELKNTVHGVEITEAPDVIRSQVVGNINFDPCATVGVGVHRVTWKWNGLNGLARQSGQTSTTFTVLPANVPGQPGGFSATAGRGQVRLAWSNPGDSSVTRWEFQQKEGEERYGSWTPITASDKDTTSHRVTGLTNDTTYGFRIRAVNGNGAGIPSPEQTARPSTRPSRCRPPPPESPKAIPAGKMSPSLPPLVSRRRVGGFHSYSVSMPPVRERLQLPSFSADALIQSRQMLTYAGVIGKVVHTRQDN